MVEEGGRREERKRRWRGEEEGKGGIPIMAKVSEL
jgi:hypothetical protein